MLAAADGGRGLWCRWARPTAQRAAAQAQRSGGGRQAEKTARINALLGQRTSPGAETRCPSTSRCSTALDYKSERKPDGRGIGVERAMAIGKAVQTPGVLEALRTRSALGKRDWLPSRRRRSQPAAPRLKGQPAPAPGAGDARARELAGPAPRRLRHPDPGDRRRPRAAARGFHASLAAR